MLLSNALRPTLPVLCRTGLITVADMSMYLGDTFDESMMEQYMRGVSSREDGMVSAVQRRGRKNRTVSRANS